MKYENEMDKRSGISGMKYGISVINEIMAKMSNNISTTLISING
jgi:hypothetical protein